ncbi:MAG: response regulator [Patescibacteria group bacterium]|nr:response regulator [Patescibacteria group bacterium]
MSKVLIVEDNSSVSRAYVRWLQKKGAIVLQAENVDEALSLILVHSDIDAVVLDGEVPGSQTTTKLAATMRRNFPSCRLVAAVGDLEKHPELVRLCDAAFEKPNFDRQQFFTALGLP